MVVVKGEGSFADNVRRVLEYARSRGIDLSGVEVEVVPDPSIRDFGAYTEHLGGLRFRIRYNPRYTGDPVLAAHEAGHVAYWTWQRKKSGGGRYIPDIDELLAEALGAVAARQLFGVPVTFKGAPLNLTQLLPQRTTHITVTVDGKPMVVKAPEWGDLSRDDYLKRYRAGILLSPYFYNVTNWAHVFGNFTAAPVDVIETVHRAWRSGAVEVVPGWGAVWRTTPTWSWPDASAEGTGGTSTTQNPSGTTPPANTPNISTATTAAVTQGNNTGQKNGGTTSGTAPPRADDRKVVVHAQPSADAPLPPGNIQPPKYFSSDITPKHIEVPEWDSYISGRRVLVVLRNWPHLDAATLKETRKDGAVGVGVVSGNRLQFEHRIPVPRVVDSNAWIEIVDEKTGKVLARLRSDELYKLSTEGVPVTLHWSHVAAEEKWPGWERFIERAKELNEKLGTWRPSGTVAPPPGAAQPTARDAMNISPDGTVSAVRVANVPTEYAPPKVPDGVRRQFENLLSELKKLREGVNLKNVGEAHSKFIQLRDKTLDIARAYPQLIDDANRSVGEVGTRIREVSDRLHQSLAKAAGRDSFWRGDGDVKTPIGVYKYDPATGAFLLSLYDRPTAENIVGYIRDDGTPVVIKKTQNMSEALDEYNKLLQKPQTAGGSKPPSVPAARPQPPATRPKQQADVLQPLSGAVDFLSNSIKAGAGVALTAFGGAKPTSTPEFMQAPSGQQRQDEFAAAVRPSRRAPDYVLAEEEAKKRRSSSGPSSFSKLFSSLAGVPALGSHLQTPNISSSFVSNHQQSSTRDSAKGRGLWGVSSPSTTAAAPSSPAQLAEAAQARSGGAPSSGASSGAKRHRGRPAAVAI